MINICAISWAEITTKKPGSIFTLPESSDAKFQLLLIQSCLYTYTRAPTPTFAGPRSLQSSHPKDSKILPWGLAGAQLTKTLFPSKRWWDPTQNLPNGSAVSNFTYTILSITYSHILQFHVFVLNRYPPCACALITTWKRYVYSNRCTMPLNLLHLVSRAANP